MSAVYPASIREEETVPVVRPLMPRTAAGGDPCGGTPDATIPYRTSGQSAGEAANESLWAAVQSGPRGSVVRAYRCQTSAQSYVRAWR
jgi:hypothetical protein